jgi:hypothetical protein
MSKKNQTPEAEGLMENDAVMNETAAEKAKKNQTPEMREALVAGVEKMKEMGISDKLAKVTSLIPDWNGGDKDSLSALKESVITEFGGSEKFKDYFDGEFEADVLAFQGIAKAIPVLNNIRAFYARREKTATRKVKTVQVSINGKTYNVDATYRDEISGLPVEERKELLLKHSATKEAEIIEEIL